MAKAIVTKKKVAQRRNKFTVAMICNLQPEAKPYPVYDTYLPGLRIMIYPTGSKVFQVYGKPHGSQRPVNCRISKEGQLPLNSSDPQVETVYKCARELITLLSQGVNPNEAKKQQAKEKEIQDAQDAARNITLRQILDRYLDTVKLADGTRRNYRTSIEKHLPDWLDLPLVAVTRAMVIDRHRELGKKHPAGANAVMRTFRTLYNYVADELENSETGESISPCPVRALKKAWNAEPPRTGHIPVEQLTDWWAATKQLTALDEDGEPVYRRGGQIAQDYLQFLILTGCRRREPTTLEWAQVNLKARTFTITSENAKNKAEATLPLCDYLVDMLTRRKKEGGTGPFPLKEVRHFVDRVRSLSEVHFTIHDLRRTFITMANDIDVNVYAIKSLVNHRGGRDITQSYDQVSMTRLRKASTKITNYILASAGERETVVSIDKARSNGR